MDCQELATYYYRNYDRWFNYVRFRRRRNIPNDVDSEVVVQDVAGICMLYADRVDQTNPDTYIFLTLNSAVGEYWRRKISRKETPLSGSELAPPSARVDTEVGVLTQRITKALNNANAKMSPLERCAFGAFWKELGDRQRANQILQGANNKPGRSRQSPRL